MIDRETRRFGLAAILAVAVLGVAPAARAQPAPVWTPGGNPELELELTTRVGTMGPEQIEAHDGYVHVGSWDLERLGPQGKAPKVFYLARVPLDLRLEEGGGRLVRKVTIELELAGSGSHVRALLPDKVRGQARKLTAFVSRDYLFSSQPAPAAIRKLDLEVEPVIDGSGAGNVTCRWELTSEGNIGVKRGDRTVFFIVAAPPGLRRLEVTAKAQIDIGREMLRIRYDNLSKVSSQSFVVDLPEAVSPGSAAAAPCPPSSLR